MRIIVKKVKMQSYGILSQAYHGEHKVLNFNHPEKFFKNIYISYRCKRK